MLFWIHGGAFTVGRPSLPLYDGGPLGELGDVVVVTHQLPARHASASCELGDARRREDAAAEPRHARSDRRAALGARQHRAFGGDPENVTHVRRVAGASSVVRAAGRARGARAVPARDRAEHARSTRSCRRASARAQHRRGCCAKLGDRAGRTSRSCATLPAAQIARRAARDRGAMALGSAASCPVLDPRRLPQHPSTRSPSPRAQLPLLLGSNRDEWNLFDAHEHRALGSAAAARRGDRAKSRAAPAAACRRQRAEALIETYARRARGAALPHHERAVLRAIEGDLRFRMPERALRRGSRARGRAGVRVHVRLRVARAARRAAARATRSSCRSCSAPRRAAPGALRGRRARGARAERDHDAHLALVRRARRARQLPVWFAATTWQQRPTMMFDVEQRLAARPARRGARAPGTDCCRTPREAIRARVGYARRACCSTLRAAQ